MEAIIRHLGVENGRVDHRNETMGTHSMSVEQYLGGTRNHLRCYLIPWPRTGQRSPLRYYILGLDI